MENLKHNLRKQICMEVDAKNIDGKTAARLLESINNLYDDKLKKLEHHRDTTIGLWAFDCAPKQLIEKFVNSQNDACSLFTEDVDKLIKEWESFCNNKNIIESPFFQIKEY
jgi:hypothetical protein